MGRSKRAMFYSIIAVSLIGCESQDFNDLDHWVEDKKNSARPRVQALKEPLIFRPLSYESTDEIDPFSMLKLTQVLNRESSEKNAKVALLTQEQNRRKEVLESYPLDSMVMVGSLRKNGQYTALLRVNQLIYQVKQGDYLGQNYGRVVQIQEDSIKLREVVQDVVGDWVERISTLDLQEGGK